MGNQESRKDKTKSI